MSYLKSKNISGARFTILASSSLISSKYRGIVFKTIGDDCNDFHELRLKFSFILVATQFTIQLQIV